MSGQLIYEGLGEWVLGITGEDLERCDVCYLTDEGQWKKANASDPNKMPAKAICMDKCSYELKGRFMIRGSIGSFDFNWGKGEHLYVSKESGKLTNIKPSGENDLIQEAAQGADDPRYIFFECQQIKKTSEALENAVLSIPLGGDNYKRVTNVYVEMVEGNPKFWFQYDDGEPE